MSTERVKESVWDYPRPPSWEKASDNVTVIFGGKEIAVTTNCIRVLETSHPPVYYFPREDVNRQFLVISEASSFCEFKGKATYWDAKIGNRITERMAWSYEDPIERFRELRGFFAFYASKVDECWVGSERVISQEGDFYGGWITSNIVGPFKGAAGTSLW